MMNNTPEDQATEVLMFFGATSALIPKFLVLGILPSFLDTL
jgi:hypothetical protein